MATHPCHHNHRWLLAHLAFEDPNENANKQTFSLQFYADYYNIIVLFIFLCVNVEK